MKNCCILFLVGMFIMSSCGGGQPENPIKAATFEVISFQTETMFAISCEKFDTYYSDKWRSKTITQKADVDRLTKLLNSLKRIDDAYQPDVRAKLLLANIDGTVDTVCMDSRVTHYKDANYETSAELANFVLQ